MTSPKPAPAPSTRPSVWKPTVLALLLLGAWDSAAQPYEPGQTYFGRSNYIEYIAGDMPVILSAPHGGSLRPAELPDRTYGVTTADANTQTLTREISSAFLARFGARPHVIICRLHREKIDCNREIVEGAQGHPLTELAWTEFQEFIEAAKSTVSNHWSRGLFLDIHGHGHVLQRLELGYLPGNGTLNLDDATLNAGGHATNTSIRHLDVLSPFTFAQLLRGTNSLGGLLSALGYPSVPSPAFPNPGGAPYFTGGYNTERHGSLSNGTLSAVQIECNFTNVRDSAMNRQLFAAKLAEAAESYLSNHFGFNPHDRLPFISAVVGQSLDEDVPTGEIGFTVSDDVTPAGDLSLGKLTSDPALLPALGIVLGGSGGNRTVRVTPGTNQSGSGTITLTATDANGGTTNRSFGVSVFPVNDPPTLGPLADRTNRVGVPLELTPVAEDVDGDALTFSLLVAPDHAMLDPLTGLFSWRPSVAQGGAGHAVEIRVTDNGTNMLGATRGFTVIVPPLSPPRLETLTLLEDGGLRFHLSGDDGPDYTVQASTNLTDWTPLFATNAPALPIEWVDTNAAAFQRRFYRAVPGP